MIFAILGQAHRKRSGKVNSRAIRIIPVIILFSRYRSVSLRPVQRPQKPRNHSAAFLEFDWNLIGVNHGNSHAGGEPEPAIRCFTAGIGAPAGFHPIQFIVPIRVQAMDFPGTDGSNSNIYRLSGILWGVGAGPRARSFKISFSYGQN
jgi:hypothetical protein